MPLESDACASDGDPVLTTWIEQLSFGSDACALDGSPVLTFMDKHKFSKLLLKGAKQVGYIRHDYFEFEDGQVVGACAIGMMVVALVGSTDQNKCDDALGSFMDEMDKIDKKEPGDFGLTGSVIVMNAAMTVEEIAQKLRAKGY